MYVTTPVRADGFDPLGNDSRWDHVPAGADAVVCYPARGLDAFDA